MPIQKSCFTEKQIAHALKGQLSRRFFGRAMPISLAECHPLTTPLISTRPAFREFGEQTVNSMPKERSTCPNLQKPN